MQAAPAPAAAAPLRQSGSWGAKGEIRLVREGEARGPKTPRVSGELHADGSAALAHMLLIRSAGISMHLRYAVSQDTHILRYTCSQDIKSPAAT